MSQEILDKIEKAAEDECDRMSGYDYNQPDQSQVIAKAIRAAFAVFIGNPWSKNKPTKPGYYWWRFDENDEPEIKKIELLPESMTVKSRTDKKEILYILDIENGLIRLDCYDYGDWGPEIHEP